MDDSGTGPRAATGPLLLQALLVYALLVALIPVIGVEKAIAGGIAGRIVVLARMPLVVLLATWLLRRRGLGWSDLGLRPIDWWRGAKWVALGVLGFAMIQGVSAALRHATQWPAPDFHVFAPLHHNLALLVGFMLPAAWISAGLCEELVFRGFLLDTLLRVLAGRVGPRAAMALGIVIQAVLFGALHFYQGPGGMVGAGMIGALLALVWRYSGRNLWPGILLHGLIDSFGFVVIFAAGVPR